MSRVCLAHNWQGSTHIVCVTATACANVQKMYICLVLSSVPGVPASAEKPAKRHCIDSNAVKMQDSPTWT